MNPNYQWSGYFTYGLSNRRSTVLVYIGLYLKKIEPNKFFFLDQLKGKLNLNIDHMDQLTMDDLKSHVDNAIGQVIQSVIT